MTEFSEVVVSFSRRSEAKLWMLVVKWPMRYFKIRDIFFAKYISYIFFCDWSDFISKFLMTYVATAL